MKPPQDPMIFAAKTIEKWRKHKLFASYLIQKPSKSIELAAAMQFLAIFLGSTKSQKWNFAGRFAKTNCKIVKKCIASANSILSFSMVFVTNGFQIACKK